MKKISLVVVMAVALALLQGALFGSRYAGEMVEVKAGSFQMLNSRQMVGSEPPPEAYHTVVLTYDFWIGKYEVTYDLYDAYCADKGIPKPNDSGLGRGKLPVAFVSWTEATYFCNWLSAKEGLAIAYDANGNLLDRYGRITRDIRMVEGYRLPTEAEWEYAAKGGHRSVQNFVYAGSNLINEVGWFLSNSGRRPQLVGQKKPNELGLYDMSGNAEDMVHDWYESAFSNQTRTNPIGPASGRHRTKRGGSFAFHANFCSIEGSRNLFSISVQFYNMGFRVARTKNPL